MTTTTAATVDEYIADFPPPIQLVLQNLRNAIKTAAPAATEKISYKMPSYELHGNLVHFAAFKNHIGFYTSTATIAKFKKELEGFKIVKGTIQFPYDKEIPFAVVTKIVAEQVVVNERKGGGKKVMKTCTNGHKFYKSSDCPVCPVCEKESEPAYSFLSTLSAPARRALTNKGITNPEVLATYAEQELLQLHGVGPTTIPKLRQVLQVHGLGFKK